MHHFFFRLINCIHSDFSRLLSVVDQEKHLSGNKLLHVRLSFWAFQHQDRAFERNKAVSF